MAKHPATKKSLGQHFLKDGNMIRKIADAIPAGPSDQVIEIGPGAGALTKMLAERFDDVTAIEIDNRMADFLEENIPQVKIIRQDVLKTDWEHIVKSEKPVHVVGNLPYYITSQILFGLLEHRSMLTSAILMMQKEVAERIVAEPHTKAYGILSVQTQLMSSPEILFDVAPQVFYPPPNVQSAVLKLTFNKGPLACTDENLKTVVRMAFNQRRKKLSNSLKGLTETLPVNMFDFSLRAEAFEPETFEKLTVQLERMGVLV